MFSICSFTSEPGASTLIVLGFSTVQRAVLWRLRARVRELAMDFEIHRPFLSTIEWIAVILIITFGVCGLGFIIYKKITMKSNTRTRALCRWGFHDWRGSGDSVIIRWKEVRVLDNPSYLNAVGKSRKEDVVKFERECLYYGLHQKRKFTMNEVGKLEVAGWETVDLTAESR